MQGRANSLLYNLISVMFLLLTCLIGGVTAAWLSEAVEVPVGLAPATDVPPPTPILFISFTPSRTPLPSLTPFPTNTPSSTPTKTSTPTITPSDTSTPTVTSTASVTPTSTPSSTFTPTFTATESPTATSSPTSSLPTNTPTPTTSPFPFVIGDIVIRQDPQESCDYQAVAGNAFDLFREPLIGLVVVVRGPGLPDSGATATTGSSGAYGTSGFEVRLGLQRGTYTVELQTPDGTVLSRQFENTFSASCSSNVLLVRFDQQRPY